MSNDKFDRQTRMIGIDGQRLLSRQSVAVIGLGGLGSLIAPQIALLGVKKLVLIDPDIIEKTNLNRHFAAEKLDVENGTKKVDAVCRMMRRMEVDCEIITSTESVISRNAIGLLQGVDTIVGGVDSDGVRLFLTEFSAAFEKIYIDAATDTYSGGGRLYFGGRVFVYDKEPGCLLCLQQIDLREAEYDLSAQNIKRDRDAIYGIDRARLDNSGPSVVTLNGVVASIATTEFLKVVTGIEKPQKLINYCGNTSSITYSRSVPPSDCYICKLLFKSGADAELEHYLSN